MFSRGEPWRARGSRAMGEEVGVRAGRRPWVGRW